VIGLIYGLTTCTFSCLPVVGTYIVGTRSSFSEGVKATVLFSIARIAGYTVMGIFFGLVGNVVKTYLSSPIVPAACGTLIILVGIRLLFSKQNRGCKSSKCSGLRETAKTTSISLIPLGLAMSFIPCLPYTAIMASAAASGSALQGAATAFLFGLGTSLSPLLLLGGATGWLAGQIGRQIPAHIHIIRKIGTFMIIFMGGRMLFLALYPLIV